MPGILEIESYALPPRMVSYLPYKNTVWNMPTHIQVNTIVPARVPKLSTIKDGFSPKILQASCMIPMARPIAFRPLYAIQTHKADMNIGIILAHLIALSWLEFPPHLPL